MRQRTIAQHAIHRAANALTGDEQTARHIAALVTDVDQFVSDPRAFLLTDLHVRVKCNSATETAHLEHHGIHAVTLTSQGPSLPDHPHLGDVELEALLAALGGPAPTCLLLASAAITEGMVAPGHEGRFTGATRTPLLTVRYLAAARAWLTRNPNTDLRAMLPVLRAGITPDGWAWWTQAGFTPAIADPFLSRRIPLTIATNWLNAGMATHRGAELAAQGVHASDVTDLIAAGLTKTVAQQWVNFAADLTADQVRNLHTRGFHPTEADAAVRQVGYDTALKYADAGLATGRKVRSVGGTWWGNFAENVPAAIEWSTRTNLDAGNAGWLVDMRNSELADPSSDEYDCSPDWVLDWYNHGVATMEELAELAPMSYHPCELDGAPRPVDPLGRPIRWIEALWLWRATGENPEPWIAASAGTPEWDDNNSFYVTCVNCPIDETGPTRCDHTRVPGPDTIVPQIGGNPHMSDLYYCRTRQALLEAMADAANERFPEHALAALAAHGPVNAERWEYAIALVRLLNDDEYVPFLTSPCAHPVNAYLPGAEATVASQVTAWRNTLTTTGGADQDAGQGTRQAAA